MTLIPKDLTPVYKATIAKGTNALRWQRATYVDLLPPCNNACPAGLNIQAFSLGVGGGTILDTTLRSISDFAAGRPLANEVAAPT